VSIEYIHKVNDKPWQLRATVRHLRQEPDLSFTCVFVLSYLHNKNLHENYLSATKNTFIHIIYLLWRGAAIKRVGNRVHLIAFIYFLVTRCSEVWCMLQSKRKRNPTFNIFLFKYTFSTGVLVELYTTIHIPETTDGDSLVSFYNREAEERWPWAHKSMWMMTRHRASPSGTHGQKKRKDLFSYFFVQTIKWQIQILIFK